MPLLRALGFNERWRTEPSSLGHGCCYLKPSARRLAEGEIEIQSDGCEAGETPRRFEAVHPRAVPRPTEPQ